MSTSARDAIGDDGSSITSDVNRKNRATVGIELDEIWRYLDKKLKLTIRYDHESATRNKMNNVMYVGLLRSLGIVNPAYGH